MQIQFNTDSSIQGRDSLFASIRPDVEKVLARYAEIITRVEIHVSDINGPKAGEDDIRAVVEIRREGKAPNAATNNGKNPRLAVLGAVEKLKRVLDSDLGKERDLARRS
ncbi:MAG: HPF/RaiA family ribosome-associated protein [Planctomycetota bacterium]|nr:MAG: HPF/RaiA family ribosome-associated protein [Planctomycetota bacterium]